MIKELKIKLSNNSRYQFWPSVLNLAPLKIPGQNFASLPNLIKRGNSGVALLKPAGSTPEEKAESEKNYETLRTLLENKLVVI